MIPKIRTIEQAIALLPRTPHEVETAAHGAVMHATRELETLYALSESERTFDNTLLAFDRILAEFESIRTCIAVVEMVHPHEAMRTQAHKILVQLATYVIDSFWHNKQLYTIFTSYITRHADQPALSAQERYYAKKLLETYERSGIHLPDHKQQRSKEIQKELSLKTLDFSRNIALDTRTISLMPEELLGVDSNFLSTLSKDELGNYRVGTDYPTYFTILENCSVERTRKALWIAFRNRAYPINHDELSAIIKWRDELAQLLGFKTYAHFDIDDQMAKTPEHVEAFLNGLVERFMPRALQEFALLTQSLPESVELTLQGKLKPWDIEYLVENYKRKHYALNQAAIAEYFPLDHVLKGMLWVYEQFLGLTFEEVSFAHSWHKDVKLLRVSYNQALVGFIFLDLYPRPSKYTHACHVNLAPTVTTKTGEHYPAVSLLICNFEPSTVDQPSLLTFKNVKVFFHEFGHALHGLLGSTELAFFSGTRVVRDFLEMPSQMLEEWLESPVILKDISKHYKTGDPLSDGLIEAMLRTKNFNLGYWAQRQIALSFLALNYHKGDTSTELFALCKATFTRMLPFIEFNEDDHFYASFGHLAGYNSKYYSYMWSQVFAHDLFSYIKKHGILNQHVGRKYVQDVLSKGGSEDPEVLLEKFLGRPPTMDAFLKDLGLI